MVVPRKSSTSVGPLPQPSRRYPAPKSKTPALARFPSHFWPGRRANAGVFIFGRAFRRIGGRKSPKPRYANNLPCLPPLGKGAKYPFRGGTIKTRARTQCAARRTTQFRRPRQLRPADTTAPFPKGVNAPRFMHGGALGDFQGAVAHLSATAANPPSLVLWALPIVCPL